MWLLLAFIAVPLIEIGLFIQIGGLIGLWPTLAIVLLTAIAGTALVRSQGLQVLGQIQGSLERLDNPTEPMAHGAMILLSGALLLTPGFFTDAVGFALLVPGIRQNVFNFLRSRVRVQSFRMGDSSFPSTDPPQGERTRPDVIDGEFHEIDPDSIPPRPGSRPSGWTRQ
jgi:UPF0716 protein FxsA